MGGNEKKTQKFNSSLDFRSITMESRRLPSFTGFYLVLPSFTGFYLVLLGFT